MINSAVCTDACRMSLVRCADERHEPRERESVYRTLYRSTQHLYRNGLLLPPKHTGTYLVQPTVKVHQVIFSFMHFSHATRLVESLIHFASKAFDKVLHNGLFLKLIKRNVPIAFVKLLKNWYSRLSCMVRWNGKLGTAFPILCGVRQGGILSPFCLPFTSMT